MRGYAEIRGGSAEIRGEEEERIFEVTQRRREDIFDAENDRKCTLLHLSANLRAFSAYLGVTYSRRSYASLESWGA
jgi:hypothetical protein